VKYGTTLKHHGLVISVATIALATSIHPTQDAFPKYGFEDGKTYTYAVKAKAEIQPYSIGGKLKLKLTSKDDDKSMLELVHEVEFIQGNERGAGGTQTSVWEVFKSLRPTGSGEGANQFGEQLMATLLMPVAAKESYPFFGTSCGVTSAVKTTADTIVVSSKLVSPSGTTTVERTLDAKTRILVKSTCVSAMAIGKINYELTLNK